MPSTCCGLSCASRSRSAPSCWARPPRVAEPASVPAEPPGPAAPGREPHTDHTDLMPGPYDSGSQVTQRCLECHEEAAEQLMATVHWTWESEPVQIEGRPESVAIGKKTALNNFCIGIQSNWPDCTACHAGYGWEEADFDFSEPTPVDCLVCHA